MQATPERAKDDKSEAPNLSRLEALRNAWMPEWLEWVSQSTYESLRDQYMPELPPLEMGAHLIPILFEIGPVMSGPMGAGSITFGEVDKWCNRIGIDLQPWESRFIVRLSREYLSEQSRATARDCPAPWLSDDEAAKPQVTAAQQALRNLANL